jgi:hypothetical protein
MLFIEMMLIEIIFLLIKLATCAKRAQRRQILDETAQK